MIFTTYIRPIAETYLRHYFRNYPSAVQLVLRPDLFNKWVELCRDRCNQLDLAGIIPSQPIQVEPGRVVTPKNVLDMFIEDAALCYAWTMIERDGSCTELLKNKGAFLNDPENL